MLQANNKICPVHMLLKNTFSSISRGAIHSILSFSHTINTVQYLNIQHQFNDQMLGNHSYKASAIQFC